MKLQFRHLSLLFAVVTLVVSSFTIGCASRHYVRVDDPYYHDQHRWSPDEDRRYHQWETDSHRDHRDYHDRNADEQKQYWEWRHNHH